ncbi:MAG: hypothetical protein QM811_24110 [Pirellulales bacterium]
MRYGRNTFAARSGRRVGFESLESRSLMAVAPFTLAVMPDTQNYAESYPETFLAQTRWIVQNQAARNIVFVSQLGDIVQNAEYGSTRNAEEWRRADAAIDQLDGDLSRRPDGLIPYSVALGNHDYGIISNKAGGTARYEEYFDADRYQGRSWYVEGSEIAGGHAQIFEAGGYRFLHITLQFEPLDADLAWRKA